MKHTEFTIENDTTVPMAIAIEPEGMIMMLEPNSFLVVKEDYDASPLTIRLSEDDSGKVVICIWPGDGNTIVEKDGKNVLEIT